MIKNLAVIAGLGLSSIASAGEVRLDVQDLFGTTLGAGSILVESDGLFMGYTGWIESHLENGIAKLQLPTIGECQDFTGIIHGTEGIILDYSGTSWGCIAVDVDYTRIEELLSTSGFTYADGDIFYVEVDYVNPSDVDDSQSILTCVKYTVSGGIQYSPTGCFTSLPELIVVPWETMVEHIDLTVFSDSESVTFSISQYPNLLK